MGPPVRLSLDGSSRSTLEKFQKLCLWARAAPQHKRVPATNPIHSRGHLEARREALLAFWISNGPLPYHFLTFGFGPRFRVAFTLRAFDMSLSVHLYSLRVPMGMTIEGRINPSASHLFKVSTATPIFSAACSVEWAARIGTVGY